jgi:superfamily II DNA or RNA helicase
MHRLYQTLADDAARNALIVADVRAALAEGRTSIVLTERRDHLVQLAELLTPHVPHCIILKGGGTDAQRRSAMGALAGVSHGEPLVILATGRYIGEGFDDARLDTLFLALPISWRGTLVQYAGRLHRLHSNKREVRIYDYVDTNIPTCARMFDRRMRGYRALGYEAVTDVRGSGSSRV